MTFISLSFLILLTVTFSIYYFIPQRARIFLLLISSYVFYCYWNWIYGLLIFVTSLFDYAAVLFMEKAKSKSDRKWVLAASIIVNLGLLSYFKYTNFALESLRVLLGPLGHSIPGPLNIVLPIGISFYTFQTISYIVDVYRGEIKAERDFILFALFGKFFPQLVAGPIERAKDLIPQLRKKQPFLIQNIEEGGRLILWGLLKKLVFSDRLTYAALPAFLNPAAYSTGELTFSAAAMLVVVYLDFSAYSEIARGTAQLFGIHLSINFKTPQASGNIADFWRRWHITMSTWVRDYLFNPLGGFHPRKLWHNTRTILITMGLVGLWHGANWTYVLWGLAHGACLLIYQLLRLSILRKLPGFILENYIWCFGAWLLNTFVRTLINILFFSPNLEQARIFYDRLLIHTSGGGFTKPYVELGFILLIGFWLFHFIQSRKALSRTLDAFHPTLRATIYTALFFIVFFGAVDSSQPFIYFQF